jgi:hypothetical protein
MALEKVLLTGNILSTFFMVGVIWLVQVVNYPLFRYAREEFIRYHGYHVRFITCVVVLPMLVELLSGILMAVYPYPGLPLSHIWLGLILIFGIWFVTIAWMAPLHRQLQGGFCAERVERLIQLNWFRVLFWSLRGILVVSFLQNMS